MISLSPELICSRLILEEAVPKADLEYFEGDEALYEEVRQRLAAVGLELVNESWSAYYGVRLHSPGSIMEEHMRNLSLDRRFVTAITLMWCKLIAPLFLDMEILKNPARRPVVAAADVFREFHDYFRNKTNFRYAMGWLRNHRYIQVRGNLDTGLISVGPLLEVKVNHRAMFTRLEGTVLDAKLSGRFQWEGAAEAAAAGEPRIEDTEDIAEGDT